MKALSLRLFGMPGIPLLAWAALSLAACQTAEIDVGESGGQVPHPLLTACEGATFELLVEQERRSSVNASGVAMGGLIVFQAPGILRFATAKPVTVRLTVTSIPHTGPIGECPYSRGEERVGRFILLKWLGKDRFGIDLEDLR